MTMMMMIGGGRLGSCIVALATLAQVNAFVVQHPFSFGVERSMLVSRLSAAPRYGPMAPNNPSGSDADPLENQSSASLAATSQTKKEFNNLLFEVLKVSDAQHIPSILAKNMELLLNMSSSQLGAEIVDTILKEAREDSGDDAAERIEEVIDLVLSFTEEFVQQAADIEETNKQVLGKIIRAISDKDVSGRDREEALDELLAAERSNFTPGFLRHIEGECDRIAAAPKMTPESARLLEILHIIQTRALEEVGQDLGQAAQVLGQLIGYESKAERLAVLEAGLAVQGVDFAGEMVALTEEALEGFTRVGGSGADPELIQCVREIDERLRRFLENESKFE
jgi:hypothetical protein